MLDLSGLTFVDSASMGELVRVDAETKAAGGKAILFGLPRVALRVLEVTGLTRSFALAENETAARARIG
jgi:anti-anti-sigma factor